MSGQPTRVAWWSPERGGVALLLALLLGAAGAAQRGLLGRGARRLLHDARNDGPNDADAGMLTRDYYRGLLGDVAEVRTGLPMQLALALLRADPCRSQEENFQQSAASRACDGFPFRELVPGAATTLVGRAVQINSIGLRDDPCAPSPPAGVVRLALLGASNDMGWGVAHEETYATQLETLLAAPQRLGRKVEVVNCSVPGYTALEQLWAIEARALPLKPHALLFSVTLPDLRHEIVGRLAARVRAGRDLGWDFVRDVVARSGAVASDELPAAVRKLRPFVRELTTGVFAELVALRERHGVPVVVLALKLEAGDEVARELAWAADAAHAAGLPVVRAFTACAPLLPTELYVDARTDHHPGAVGHRRLAEELADPIAAIEALRRVTAVSD
jgi:hypothetical protein